MNHRRVIGESPRSVVYETSVVKTIRRGIRSRELGDKDIFAILRVFDPGWEKGTGGRWRDVYHAPQVLSTELHCAPLQPMANSVMLC